MSAQKLYKHCDEVENLKTTSSIATVTSSHSDPMHSRPIVPMLHFLHKNKKRERGRDREILNSKTLQGL